ncbi:MAG: pentapeptide repeat-containing protein, partial [Halobacteriota archaeon]
QFEGARIERDARFEGARIGRDALFAGATIGGDARFMEATIGGGASFAGAKIGRDAQFKGATIKGGAAFVGATLVGGCEIADAELRGPLYFVETQFCDAKKGMTRKQWENKEEACRKAKQVWDGRGVRSTADDYFYREMEARRMQKKPEMTFVEAVNVSRKRGKEGSYEEGSNPPSMRTYLRDLAEYYLEYPAQHIFGFGVHPEWLFRAFVIALVVFGTFYWLAGVVSGFFESLYFSFTTMLLPGSALASPKPGIVGLVLVIQSLFGLLVWGTFIGTLTRKFGR